MQKDKTQFGRSMVEMLAVLGIIGVISTGALAGFRQAMTKYRVSKTHTDIQSINTDVVNLFSWQRTYPNSSTTNFKTLLCDNGVFPDGCEGDKAYNPFGGEYTVTTDQDDQTMTITAGNIPAEACESLRNKEWRYTELDADNKAGECTGADDIKEFSITFE